MSLLACWLGGNPVSECSARRGARLTAAMRCREVVTLLLLLHLSHGRCRYDDICHPLRSPDLLLFNYLYLTPVPALVAQAELPGTNVSRADNSAAITSLPYSDSHQAQGVKAKVAREGTIEVGEGGLAGEEQGVLGAVNLRVGRSGRHAHARPSLQHVVQGYL